MKKLILALLMLALMLTLTACKCKHEVTLVVNAKDATCTEEGYTGDTVCGKCEEVVTPGAAIPAVGHVEGEPQNVIEATCTEEGYTGDVLCTVCEMTLEAGEVVEMLPHTPGERVNVVEATCTAEGYTGDVFCTACPAQLEAGEAVAMLPHTPGELTGALEPTCTEEGYTGDVFCTVCGAITEQGSSIPAPGHTPGEPGNVAEPTCLHTGYTGDFPCTACGEILPGEVIAKIAHAFESDTCTACGWRTPGLYISGTLEFGWDELVENGYAVVDGGVLRGFSNGLHGDLVVSEAITELDAHAFHGCQLSKVTLPVDCNVMGQLVFEDSKSLEEVVFFGAPEEINGGLFSGCEDLVSIVIPDSVTFIDERAFEGCASLETVVLPDGIVEINQYAFENCTALKDINVPASLQALRPGTFRNCLSLTAFDLPDGFQLLGAEVFTGSGVTHLTFPATTTEVFSQADADSLVYVDMSRMTCTTLSDSGLFNGCDALEEIIFPAGLVELDISVIANCPMLKQITLPEHLASLVTQDGQLTDTISVTITN